ncbi:MFS transporter [Fictibacillus aquaticus]|uniref:MFS transporter n=1 Tax=Fictibacillus aquaticus TaxID=2021314 RepID=A0A235FEC3_9BACL|nr:MFS transporter [Fictibacillus aquaticus]OYD59277.1 MFS transporter [Fictibacillus aquaticus]
MKEFIRIFQNRNFLKLFLANFTSTLGSIIGVTAFMFYLLDTYSGKPVYATMAELMYALPTMAVFFLVGVVADRMDRQKVAVYSDYICAFLSLVLIFTIESQMIVLVFAVLFLRSAIGKFFFPADQAMLQGILSKDEYAISAGINQMVSSVFMLFGTMIAVFIYWAGGIKGAIAFDMVTFLVSGLLIQSMKVNKEVRLPNGPHTVRDLHLKMVWKDFASGFSYIWNYKLLLTLIMGFFVFGMVNGALSVMPAFIMKYKLAPDNYEKMLMIMGVVFGIAVLAGSVICSMLVKKLKLSTAIIWGLIITGIFIGLCGLPKTTFYFYVMAAGAGLSIPLTNIGLGGWMPKIVDKKMMGRVQGWISPLQMLSHSLTLGFIALFYPKIVSINVLFYAVGGALVLVGIFYMILLPRFEERKEVKEEKPAAAVGV